MDTNLFLQKLSDLLQNTVVLARIPVWSDDMANWRRTEQLPRTFRWTCGYCDEQVASKQGFWSDETQTAIAICPNCEAPSFMRNPAGPVPAPKPGRPVHAAPTELARLYDEARRCAAAQGFTGAVLLCRKLLMHVAVHLGAEEGQSFVAYVNHLDAHHWIPPNSRGWVDYIRKRSNEANHEIVFMSEEDASSLIYLAEMLLRTVYELPSKVPLAQ